MSTIWSPSPVPPSSPRLLRLKPTTPFPLSTISLPFHRMTSFRRCSIKVDVYRRSSSDLVIRKPKIVKDAVGINCNVEGTGLEEYIDWEDQILNETAPMVRFVRMVLRSGTYENGDRLSPQHENTIVERLLRYHPESEKKIGCGIDYITVGDHPEFEGSRCLFIVREDKESVDFSYRKCIKGLIRKKYPLYADSFISRHFDQRNQNT